MVKYSKYFLFLFLLFLSLGVIVDNVNLGKEKVINSQQVKSTVEDAISEYLEKVSQDLKKVTVINDEGDSVAVFEEEYETDFVIYNNERFCYWTDNSLPLNLASLNEKFTLAVFQEKSGVYLKRKYALEDGRSICFFLRLKEDYPVSNRYLSSDFNSEYIPIKDGVIETSQVANAIEISVKGEPLFYLVVFKGKGVLYYLNVVFYLLAILFYGFLILVLLRIYDQRGNSMVSILIMLFGLVSVRLFLFYTSSLRGETELALFDSTVYGSSSWNPSIGDFVLHLLVVVIFIAYTYKQLISKKIYRYISLLRIETSYVIMIALVVLSYLSIEVIHFFLNDLYTNSTINFDITKSVDFSTIEYAYIVIFVGLSIVYLMLNRAFLKVFYFLFRRDVKIAIPLFLTGGFVYFLLSTLSGKFIPLLFVIHSVYLIIVYTSAIFHEIRSFNFNSYLYIIITTLVSSFIGAYTVYEHTDEQDERHRVKFAEKLIVHDDLEGEYLLFRVREKIQKDVANITAFTDSTISVSDVQTSVSGLLGNYFDKYRKEVLLFDGEGQQITNEYHQQPLSFFKDKFRKQKFKTEYPDLFFVNFYDFGEFSKYLSFVPIDSGSVVKTVLIELTSRQLSPNSVYPIVLSQNESDREQGYQKLNYAVYSNNKLLFSAGEYNYSLDDFDSELHREDYYQYVLKKGYNHVVYKGGDDKVVIVSSKDDAYYEVFTNFSFLLLVTLISILMMVLFYVLTIDFSNVWPNFSTRIHIYLNFIYLIAIIAISAITVSWINDEYTAELKSNYKSKAENIRLNIIEAVDEYQNGRLNENAFKESLRKVRDLSRADLNIYDTTGKLVMSSQPMIFTNELVSEMVHPSAFHSIIGKKHNLSLQQETIGSFGYYNVYTRLSTIDEDRLIGILGIPFFNSEQQLSERRIKLFNVILNVFTAVFIVVLLVSYFAFRNITTPLKMLASRIRNTTLSDKNEKIEWKVNDEIGWIVQGYNNMISKLEHSKKLMAERQKEDAWKEMARQVAHEIKNPLTPMQLKIQHLKRRLHEADPEQIESTMNSLLTQIDTLNEIATSFSDFAKMPTPKYLAFNVIDVLNEVAQLFQAETSVITDFKEEELMIMGDSKFITRVFNNIIINAIQSVKSDVRPQIIIQLDKGSAHVVIKFSDNGEGIPEEIREKVFQPNFSTKYSGSGLGLAIAQRGLQHGGGKIWFESETGKGTTFFVQLPLAHLNA